MNPPDHRQRDKTLEFISIAALLAFSLFLVLGSDRIADLLLSFDRSTSFETTMKSNMHSKEPSKFKGFKNGVVATEHEICSQVGIGLMRAGGSAVDASIGSLLCVGVLHNFASGIGGGGVMLVQTSEDKNNPKVIDFRETAPASASEDMFIGPGGREKATVSVHSIAIPGEIGGFAEAHRRWGILKWKDIFEPAIRIASLGFPASRKLEEMVNKNIKLIMADSGLRKTFIKEDGTPIKTGNIIIRPELAKTLQIIAEEGEDAFYKPGGSIATKIIDFFLKKSKQSDTVITFKDLADYKIVVRDAIKISIPDGYEIISSGAPTSGAVVLQALAVIKRLGHVADEKITLQRMIEALKFAYADRMKLGDPAFVAEMNDFVEDMISPTRIDLISGRITDNITHDPRYYLTGVYEPVKDRGTTTMSAFGWHQTRNGDRAWQMVSCTSTINHQWGSGISDPDTGILFNNHMDDFSSPDAPNYFEIEPSKSNRIAPGKRPVSSAAPVMVVKNGIPTACLGGAGGSKIISSVLQLGMGPFDSVSGCRLHHQLQPNVLMVEPKCDPLMVRRLQDLGHKIRVLDKDSFGTSVNMVAAASGDNYTDISEIEWVAISDERKGGVGAGW